MLWTSGLVGIDELFLTQTIKQEIIQSKLFL
jgi:hypothetical protein